MSVSHNCLGQQRRLGVKASAKAIGVTAPVVCSTGSCCHATQLSFCFCSFIIRNVKFFIFCFFFFSFPSSTLSGSRNKSKQRAHCRQRRNSNAKLQAGALSISSHTAPALNRLNWTSASLRRRRMESRQHLSPLPPLSLFLSHAHQPDQLTVYILSPGGSQRSTFTQDEETISEHRLWRGPRRIEGVKKNKKTTCSWL